MASKYDWEFIKPLDQTANIAAMTYGNQQMLAGLQGMGTAVTGLADHYKQRNTDDILNTLMQAQTSQDLPNAMSAVQALQQQYGRGYDQTKVRDAIDTRGQVLNQRDMQALQYQQAQAQHDAMPMVNEAMAGLVNSRQGVSPEQQAMISQLAQAGYDTTGIMNTMGNLAVGDFRDDRTFTTGRIDRAEDVQWRKDQAKQQQENWEENNMLDKVRTAASTSSIFAQDPQNGWTTDAEGNPVPFSSPGVSKGSAFGAIMDSLTQAESRGVHRKADGSLTRSPKGALGVMQIMPATAAKPGYGMKPIDLERSTPEQQRAWSEDYITRIAKHHNFSTEQAVAAYNAGPGATEKAIKKGGSNWLSHLPKETQDYVPKVMGGANLGTTSNASNAVGTGRGVSQENMSKVTSSYQNTIAKLSSEFAVNEAKAKTKGSLAATGKNVDTWLAGKNETSILGGGTNPMFTRSADIVAMAKAEPLFKDLPADAQLKILDGAYGFVNSTGIFEYVPNKELKKFIKNESSAIKQDSKNQFNVAKEAAFDQAYQSLVQQYQAVGAKPPTREGAKRLLDPQSSKASPAPKKASTAQDAVKAVQPPKPASQPSVPYANAGGPKPVPVPAKAPAAAPVLTKAQQNAQAREARKEVQRAAASERYVASQKPKDARSAIDKLTGGAKPLINNNRTLSAKELEEFMRKYKVQ